MSDTMLYHEESMEETSQTTSRLSRSVSHYEHTTTEVTEQSRSSSLSRSYDSTLSQVEQPVPPPRRNRQRGTKSRNTQYSTLPSLPSDPSFNQQQEEQRDKRAEPMVKRMSADSLNSMSETSETSEYGSREDMDYMGYTPSAELGTLQKSPSGAHLYLSEETSETESGSKRSPRKAKAIVTIQEEPSQVFDTPGAKSLSEEIEEIKSGSPDQDALLEDSSVEEEETFALDPAALSLSLGSLEMKHAKESVIDRSVLRKGMTPKGADVFPGHICRQLITQSFHEADNLISGNGQNRLPSYEEHQRRRVDFTETKSYRSKGLYKDSPLQRSKYLTQDISLSDTSLSVPLIQGEPDIGSLDDSSIDTNSDIDPYRPSEPPSYTEALQRRALNKKKLNVPISEDDCIDQLYRSAQAKKLFENSQRLYNQQLESRTSTEPKQKLSSVKLESPKKEQVVRKSIIKTERKSLVEIKSAKQLREQKTSKVHKSSSYRTEKTKTQDSHMSEELQKSEEVKRSAMQAMSPARRRRLAKAEETSNVHRHSDTGLENVIRKNAENAERNRIETEGSRVYLNRSKSDSADMLDKASKYKYVEITWDTEKSDKLNNNSNMGIGRNVRSVRNRDWHKELAAQYDSYDVPSVRSEVKVTQNSEPMYISHTNNNSNEIVVKRRWSRPIHPTKDLAPHLRSFLQEDNKTRPHSTHFDHTTHHIPARDSNKNMKHTLEERTRIVSERLASVQRSESSPMSITQEQTTPHSDRDTSLHWSVSGLRTKFDQSSKSPVTRNGSDMSERRRLLLEKTIPSEISYV